MARGKIAGARDGPPPMGLGLQVSYGLGASAFGVGGVALSATLLQLFFNQVVGLPAIWVGAAILLTVVIDSVIDPLIGLFSDRLRSPWGRRHTLMYAAAAPAALGVYLMWHAPHGLPPAALLAFMIAMLIFVNVAISLYEIPSLALAPELAPDYQQRSSLLAWRWLFLIGSGAAITVVLYQVFLRQDAANPTGVLNRDRWEDFGLLAAVIVFVTILASTASTHRRIRHLHRPALRRAPLRETLVEIRAAFSHGPLMMIMLGGLFMGFGAGTTAGLTAYYQLYFWELKPQDVSYVAGAALPAALIALWAGPWLGGRFGKKQAIIGLYVAWLLVTTVPIGLRLMGLMPPNGSPVLLAILIGVFMTAVVLALSCHINLGSCIADCVDDIAVKSGKRSEALMFAVNGVLDKCANGGGAFMAGAILSFVAFPVIAQPGTVPQSVLREMAMVQLPIIVVFNLISIGFLSRYGLTRADHERNAAELARRNAEAAAPPGPGAVAEPSTAPA